MSNLRVLIVGCGNIAGGFDAARSKEAQPLTHAGSFLKHGGFSLIACVDPDSEKLSRFRERWNVLEAHASVDTVANRERDFDVISICSPTVLHPAHLQMALDLRPKLVFCEKPVTPSLKNTSEMVRRYDEAGVLLVVNYTRRWAPDVLRLRNELAAGDWGIVRSVAGYYNKGVLNNGSHMIDMLHCLFGPLSLISVGKAVWDYWEDDPSIPAVLSTEDGLPVCLNVAHASDYSLFEIQVVTERGVIAMEGGGQHWRIRQAERSRSFAGYLTLDSGRTIVGEYDRAMSNAISNIYNALMAGERIVSIGHTAMEAQRVCENIRDASLTLLHNS